MVFSSDADGMEFRKTFAGQLLAVEQSITRWKRDYPATNGVGVTGAITEIEGYLPILRQALLTYNETQPTAKADRVCVVKLRPMSEALCRSIGISVADWSPATPLRDLIGVRASEAKYVIEDLALKKNSYDRTPQAAGSGAGIFARYATAEEVAAGRVLDAPELPTHVGLEPLPNARQGGAYV
jgi:hypothetical protein